MMMRFVVVLAAVHAAAGLGRLDERNKKDLWVAALERCGDDARDENVVLAVQCQEEMQTRYASAEGVAGFEACDKEYCTCTRGTWENGACTPTNECKEDCTCMEQCYAKQMECSFEHTVRLYATRENDANACDAVELTQCVRNTKSAFVAECKRGLGKPQAFISWMSQPVPQGCNADLVCGPGSAAAVSTLVLLLSAVAVMLA
eukprot:TRINITY_DN28765_c0_g1_i1.p2 TRINITY_DN28765_c0_g1~~TRINITY_DN28765_c0_g1_i1.p2  ORF type:complete len:203 (+),score=76.97 TRINITY_DN28765_c0_g1_i1:234-842(+)